MLIITDEKMIGPPPPPTHVIIMTDVQPPLTIIIIHPLLWTMFTLPPLLPLPLPAHRPGYPQSFSE